MIQQLLKYYCNWSIRLNPRRIFGRGVRSPRIFRERYTFEDNVQVTLYTDNPNLFPEYKPRRLLNEARSKRTNKISLVITARNEIRVARQLISDIQNQQRMPDEIIIVDTGSHDGTLELLQHLAVESDIPMQVISEPGGNIARGRNVGILAAQYSLIAVTDFGCQIPSEWLEALVAPFEDDRDIQVVAGRYDAVGPDGKPTRWLLGRTLSQIDPQTHLPSGVSIAFHKDVWQQVNGYPEWLTLTGEDTYFAFELRRTTMHWAFVPDAFVRWEAPTKACQYFQKAYRWSIGDGESGTNAFTYRYAAYKLRQLAQGLLSLCVLLVLAILLQNPIVWGVVGFVWCMAIIAWGLRLRKQGKSLKIDLLLIGVYISQVLGFLKGRRNRPQVDLRRQNYLKGIFFILAGVPIDDTGGGSRWAQIALELLRRQYLVVFINKFPKYETIDLNLSISHPNLITETVDTFDWKIFSKKFVNLLNDVMVSALVELPLPDFQTIIENIRQSGGQIIYDLLDNWDSSLGGDWYHETSERNIIAQSQHLIATAPALVARLQNWSERQVTLLPNAVNGYLFNSERAHPRPDDLPVADWVVIYVGALWGVWFDWDLLLDVAQAYPTAAVVVIGDYAGQCENRPHNLHFLGLKSQRSLPAYLAHADVTFIPWKVNDITQATSPLKAYEYLAMCKPVVAPNIIPLQNLPGVYLANNRAEFIELVGKVRGFDLPKAEIVSFIEGNTWKSRTDTLLRMLETSSL